MSGIISVVLPDSQSERLNHLARQLNRSQSETASMLLDEALRMVDHPHVVFRNSALGRQAFVSGTGLAVWEMVWLARAYHNEVTAVAGHLEIAPELVEAGLQYAHHFPQEIEAAIEDQATYDRAKIQAMLPHLEIVTVPDDPDIVEHP
ncbi:MAG: hypothetical protein JOZ41_21655 [Chloroflexi bacterium]|nr:hypothetical protein [Chloroflexota bacterium]